MQTHSLFYRGFTVLTPEVIEELLSPLLQGSEIELFRVQVRGTAGRVCFVITLDHREHNITLDECAEWSRRFEDALDIAEDVPRRYALDVTSPGVGHSLTKEWEFRKSIGKVLQVSYQHPGGDEAQATLKAKLSGVEDGMLVFEDEQRIEFERLISAKVTLPW